jgi:hypothetical protein
MSNLNNLMIDHKVTRCKTANRGFVLDFESIKKIAYDFLRYSSIALNLRA